MPPSPPSPSGSTPISTSALAQNRQLHNRAQGERGGGCRRGRGFRQRQCRRFRRWRGGGELRNWTRKVNVGRVHLPVVPPLCPMRRPILYLPPPPRFPASRMWEKGTASSTQSNWTVLNAFRIRTALRHSPLTTQEVDVTEGIVPETEEGPALPSHPPDLMHSSSHADTEPLGDGCTVTHLVQSHRRRHLQRIPGNAVRDAHTSGWSNTK